MAAATGLAVAANTAAALPPTGAPLDVPPSSTGAPGNGVADLTAGFGVDVSGGAAVSDIDVSGGPDCETDRLMGVGGRPEFVGMLTAGGAGACKRDSCRVSSGPLVKNACVYCC